MIVSTFLGTSQKGISAEVEYEANAGFMGILPHVVISNNRTTIDFSVSDSSLLYLVRSSVKFVSKRPDFFSCFQRNGARWNATTSVSNSRDNGSTGNSGISLGRINALTADHSNFSCVLPKFLKTNADSIPETTEAFPYPLKPPLST